MSIGAEIATENEYELRLRLIHVRVAQSLLHAIGPANPVVTPSHVSYAIPVVHGQTRQLERVSRMDVVVAQHIKFQSYASTHGMLFVVLHIIHCTGTSLLQ